MVTHYNRRSTYTVLLNEKPYIMLYDDENNPHFYYVKGKPGLLLKQMQVKT